MTVTFLAPPGPGLHERARALAKKKNMYLSTVLFTPDPGVRRWIFTSRLKAVP